MPAAGAPRSDQSSARLTTKSGFPSVASWTLRASPGERSSGGSRAARTSSTSPSESGRSAISRQRSCTCSSRFTAASGCTPPATSAGRYVRDDEEPRALAPARQRREQVERRRIAPVEIFEHQDERPLRRQHLERVGQLAQHAVARRAGDPALCRLELRIGGERRQLDEPGRRVPRQHARHVRALRGAAEAPERLEHRQIGLALAEVLHALAARRPDAARLRRRDEGVHERGLADPRLARHEGETARARLRLGEDLRQLAQIGSRAPRRARAAPRGRARPRRRLGGRAPPCAPARRSGSRAGRASR